MPTLIQPSFAKGEIAPQLYGRVDTSLYRVALRKARNAIIHVFGGVSNRPGTVFIGPVKTHSEENVRLIPFQFNTDDQYVLEFGNQYMRVIRNDGHVLNNTKAITAITQADPAVVTVAGHGYSNGQEVFITSVGGMTQLNGNRFIIANVTANTFELTEQFTGTGVDSRTYGAYTSGGIVADIFELATPYVSADLFGIKYVQSADTMTLVHTNYDPRDLTRTGHNVWSLDVIAFAPAQPAPTGVIVTPAAPASTSYEYAVTALTVDTFEESLAATQTIANGAATPNNTISWSAASGAGRYSVYRKTNGLFGFVGETEELSFIDNNIIPDTALSPPTARTPFSGVNNKPGAVTYYEQRQSYGGSVNKPDTLWTSKAGARKNMSISFPLQDDDAITATLNSAEVNEIRHLVAGEDLLVFTSASEWRINSGSDTAFGPNTAKFRPQSQWGSSQLPPIRVGDQFLFAEDGAARVRSLGFSFQIDGYTGSNLSLLASHMLAEEAPNKYVLRDWCFQYFPEPRLHMVRSDGAALTMTYDQEQEVVAWTTWDTEGRFESCTSLRRALSSVEDGIYFVVRRVINGHVVRFIERLHTRKFADIRDAFFLDAASTLDAPIEIGTISITGDLVVTTSAPHGLVVGDIVEFDGIEWAPISVDDFGNETPPDFLNGRRYTILEVPTTTTFKLEEAEVL